MRTVLTMPEFDHFLATLLIGDATPARMDSWAKDFLASATMEGPGRELTLRGSDADFGNLLWAMDRAVGNVELGMSRCLPSCCDAFDHDWNVRLDEAARRLGDSAPDEDDVDHDGDDDIRDDDLVDCGPEFPVNDAGEWVGRM